MMISYERVIGGRDYSSRPLLVGRSPTSKFHLFPFIFYESLLPAFTFFFFLTFEARFRGVPGRYWYSSDLYGSDCHDNVVNHVPVMVWFPKRVSSATTTRISDILQTQQTMIAPLPGPRHLQPNQPWCTPNCTLL